MEKIELLQKLITQYKDSIHAIQDLTIPMEAYGILRTYNTTRGVCWCAKNVFGVDIYGDLWPKRYGAGYWTVTPSHHNTVPQMIASLQTRLGILEIELSKTKSGTDVKD